MSKLDSLDKQIMKDLQFTKKQWCALNDIQRDHFRKLTRRANEILKENLGDECINNTS